jgi:hypothetical protein
VKFRTLVLITLLGSAAGGAGVWELRPDLMQPAVERWQSLADDWRDKIDSARDQGQAWLSKLGDMVGIQPSSLPAVVAPATRQVVWASAGGELLRTEVPNAVHDAFVAALRTSQAQDRDRLARLAEQRLRQEAEPQIADAVARIPAFLDDVWGVRAQLSAIGGGFNALVPATGDTATSLSAKAAAVLGDRFAEAYRQQVLRPDYTIAAVRAAAGRVSVQVRTDLIRSCDRYDQAFRAFLQTNATRVETLNGDGRWVPAEWRPADASFRSLCQTLRATRTEEGMFDDAVLRGLAEPPMAVHDIAREIARPASEVVGGMSASYNRAFAMLSGWLPEAVAKVPAVVWSYGVSSPALVSHLLLGPALPADYRGKVEAALRDATQAGMSGVLGGISSNLMTYVDGELNGIASGVSARVERPRNDP